MDKNEYMFAMKLMHVPKNTHSKNYCVFLTDSERHELAKACIDIRILFDWDFNFQDFYKTFATYNYPPLEFLWNLHILQIMPLEMYILSLAALINLISKNERSIFKHNENYVIYSEKCMLQKFTESILKLCVQDFEKYEAQYLVQTGFLSYLVDKAFPGTDFANDERVKEICFGVIKSLLQEVFSMGEDEIKRFTCLFSLWNAGILEKTSLMYFCSFSLDFYLNFKPIIKDLEAFEILENSCTGASSCTLTVIEKILKVQKMDEIACVLKSAIHKNQINAKSLFIIVKVFLKTHKESSIFISKLVSEIMNEAYEKFSHKMLLRSLLIGYQTVSQLKLHYRVWLQAVFRDCGYSKDRHSFSLLIQVLSDFVPFQKNIEHLKVAIDLNFPVPSEMQTMYGDYIALLKTRVQDLKPATKLDITVEKALSLYESSGKIPPVVMETSLFQKHKFLNEFLPALLIPRVVPPVPDVRERFIGALFKAGKIPDYSLQKYKNECVQKQKKIIEDISMIDDNCDDFISEDNN